MLNQLSSINHIKTNYPKRGASTLGLLFLLGISNKTLVGVFLRILIEKAFAVRF
jgi:hypothetical protein